MIMESSLLHTWFSSIAKKNENQTALVSHDGTTFTFRELDEVSDHLAKCLQSHGIKDGDVIAIVSDVCTQLAISIIAILKAGGAYLHIDSSHKHHVIEHIYQSVQPTLTVTTDEFITYLPDSVPYMVIGGRGQVIIISSCSSTQHTKDEIPIDVLERKDQGSKDETEEGRTQQSADDNADEGDKLAYIALTSGSTGLPKAILGHHRGLVHSIKRFLEFCPYQSDEKEACHVAFIWEFLRPLLSGSTVYLLSNSLITDPWKLGQYINNNKITRIFLTSSIVELMVDILERSALHLFESLRVVILCGEPVTIPLLRKCLTTMPHVIFLNLYGISEAVDVACINLNEWFNTNRADSHLGEHITCPVGQPIPGVKVLVLNNDYRKCERGEIGEIYISGMTVAHGYHEPALSKGYFINSRELLDLFEMGESPVYKSGDRGMIDADGSINVIGRIDRSVKLNGIKVDLQAIHKLLSGVYGVKCCHVMKRKCANSIMVFVVCHQPQTCISKLLSKTFPGICIIVIKVHRLPISAISGKVDESILMEEGHRIKYELKTFTSTEKKIKQIWSNLLNHDFILRDDDFIKVGGDSLLLPRLQAKIKEIFGLNISIALLVEKTILRQMAHLVDNASICEIRDRKHMPFNVLETEVIKYKEIILREVEIQHNQELTNIHVLLTGATGYLGVHILDELMNHPEIASITCIVRRKGNEKAKVCLQHSLDEYKLQHLRKHLDRLEVIEGDLSFPKFDLDSETYRRLATSVTHVIHAAALVNMVLPYESLVDANIIATCNILKFVNSNTHKRLSYISSISVLEGFPTHPEVLLSSLVKMQVLDESCRKDATSPDSTDSGSVLTTGYSQSKWICERLVQECQPMDYLTTIYRPGYLSPSFKTNRWNKKDGVFLFLQHCLSTSTFPSNDEIQVNLTPVDFAAKFIVENMLVFGHASLQPAVYHIVNPCTTQFSHKQLAESTRTSISVTDDDVFQEWIYGLKDERNYENKNTLVKLRELGLEYPVITDEILKFYLKAVLLR